MSSDLGLLCRKKNASSLAYKKRGSGRGALIYKALPRPVNIVVSWSPMQYTCNTYGVTHEVNGSVSWSFTSGQGRLESSDLQPNAENRLTFVVTSAPATLRIGLSLSTNCAAQEYMSETMRLMVSQRNVTPKMKMVSADPAPGPSAAADINIDENGDVASIS